MAAGQRPYDHNIVRESASLIAQLPAMDSSELDVNYYTVRSM